jgi:hypothetical protein
MFYPGIRYSRVREGEETISYKTGHAKDALAEVGQSNLGDCNFPLSPIRYAFTTESSRDDLMAETYPCSGGVISPMCKVDQIGWADRLS